MKENQEFLWRLADEQLDQFVERGECEFLEAYSKPYSLLAVANLLGVPEADHEEFRAVFGNSHTVGNLEHDPAAINPLDFLDEKFSFYIEDRRREPRGDVLSDLAAAKYPDGVDARGRRRRAYGHLLVRGRPGNDRQAARRRIANPLRPA